MNTAALSVLLFFASQLPSEPRVSFGAVGDIMLARGIKTKIEKYGIGYPLKEMSGLISSYDLAFCNLECPISARGRAAKKPYCFRADTTTWAALKAAGLDIFSLANNHTLDWGEKALLDTKALIERDSLFAVGAGIDQAAARSPIIIRRNGLKFAFLAFVGVPFPRIAGAKPRPGPAQAKIEEIIAEVRAVRNEVDFVVVSLHWGIEYQSKPTRQQVEWAHRLIDSGVDLIIGHHPHTLQSIEVYKGRIILYSLGNFVFDQRKEFQRESGIFSCIFRHGRIDSVVFVPVFLKNFQPDLAGDSDFSRIVAKMKKISKAYRAEYMSGEDGTQLADDSGNVSWAFPLTRQGVDGRTVLVYRDRIELTDTSGTTVAGHVLSGREIYSSVLIPDSGGAVLIAAGRRTSPDRENHLAYFRIGQDEIAEIGTSISKGSCPMKLELTDLETDSVPELAVGYNDQDHASLPYTGLSLYRWKADSLSLVWSGARPCNDFSFSDLDQDGLVELITLERETEQSNRVIGYQWCGCGFFEWKCLAVGRKEAFLSDVDIKGPFNTISFPGTR